jgi:isopenicillin N synthase-like dioxygenase
MAGNFQSIPILDYSLLSTERRDEFVLQLRNALINVGFLYLSNPPVDKDVIDSLLSYVPKLFDLPQQEKDAIRMENSEHFLGYSKLGSELTKGSTDQREQFDFATEYQCKWKPGSPEYLRLDGESQVSIIDLPLPHALTPTPNCISGPRMRPFRDSRKRCSSISRKSRH